MGRSSGGGFRREVRCMRAFLDTNVILEFFLDREAGKTACQLFAKYRDIEDSCQFQAAKKAGCKVLITFNEGDYPVADDVIPRVMTPQEFLETT